MGEGTARDCFTSIELSLLLLEVEAGEESLNAFLTSQVPLSHPLIQDEDAEIRKHQQSNSECKCQKQF